MMFQFVSVRCCGSMFRLTQSLHRGYFQHRTLHIISSRPHQNVLNCVKNILDGKTLLLRRKCSTGKSSYDVKTTTMYVMSGLFFMIGVTYASVPLYRKFCQATGRGGTAVKGHDTEKVEFMTPVREKPLTIIFSAEKHAQMQWNFKPQQNEIKVVPGETALAFYKAKNPTDKPIVGISTYNIVPFEAGLYFNKIQCFCFEEQILNPHEEVDMPVFFYIDPDFMDDPAMAKVDKIVLSYTFFEAKYAKELPYPGFANMATQ